MLFWGLRDLRPWCAPGFQHVVVHIGGVHLESCRLDPAASLNFQEPFAQLDLVGRALRHHPRSLGVSRQPVNRSGQ